MGMYKLALLQHMHATFKTDTTTYAPDVHIHVCMAFFVMIPSRLPHVVFPMWLYHYRLYSKSSLTLKEWRFNLSFPWVSVLFLNSWRVSPVPYYVTTHPPAIQKQHWYSREAQIEPPLFECEHEWAFRIQAYIFKALSCRNRCVTL
jgi:hypothetical protein